MICKGYKASLNTNIIQRLPYKEGSYSRQAAPLGNVVPLSECVLCTHLCVHKIELFFCIFMKGGNGRNGGCDRILRWLGRFSNGNGHSVGYDRIMRWMEQIQTEMGIA